MVLGDRLHCVSLIDIHYILGVTFFVSKAGLSARSIRKQDNNS